MSLFDGPIGVPVAPAPAPAESKPMPKARKKAAAKKAAAKKPMAEHVVRKLESIGAMDTSLHGPPAVRRAYSIFCPSCRHPIMRGLLSMPTPWPVDVDPAPLTPQGEALMLLAGRRTYSMYWRYDQYNLEFRGNWSLRYEKAGEMDKADVLAEHRCGEQATWPPALTRLLPLRTETSAELPLEAPF